MKTLYTSALLVIICLFSSVSSKAHTLPAELKFTDVAVIHALSVKHNVQKQINTITWEVQNAEAINYFIVESSTNGCDFKTIGYVFAGEVEVYAFKTAATSTTTYRVKAVSKDDVAICASTIK
ncbi:MAG TPA: hypothetical protein VM368_05385 [Flavisolibacter sp.]|nr:hypothetical protein [Flavisolibacter sp.]